MTNNNGTPPDDDGPSVTSHDDSFSTALLGEEPSDEPEEEPETEDDNYIDFLKTFFRSRAAIHILVIAFLLSLGLGCTVGIVPDIMTDRYARLNHGYNSEIGGECGSFDRADKPDECQRGADDAQQAAAISTLATNILTLLCNSVIGSISDVHGRRNVLMSSLFLSTLSPAVLVLMQIAPGINPFWFYAATSVMGVVNYVSVSFATLSDVVPERYRAPGFGVFMGTFYLAFCFSPSLALVVDHWQLSVFSFVVVVIGFLYTVCFLPETLSRHVAYHNQSIREDDEGGVIAAVLRPIKELSILNRNMALRIVAVGSFLSGVVFSCDATLCLYYIEDQLNVRDSDLASMFIVMGIVGVLMQAFLLKFLITLLGEKGLLITSFISGTFHNLFYGIAKTKFLIYVALSLSQLTKTNFPILSSLASANANEYEQGRIQGALFALSALANAIGPVTLQYIYHCTKDTNPGFMFVVAAFLYLCGTISVSFLPTKKQQDETPSIEEENDLETPLLDGDESVAS
jgi:DHA1 family tetracycline resistance protein-like MFS transporter